MKWLVIVLDGNKRPAGGWMVDRFQRLIGDKNIWCLIDWRIFQ